MDGTTLAASVVLTFTLLDGGCDDAAGPPAQADSPSVDGGVGDSPADDDEWSSTDTIRRNADGTCTLTVSVRCPRGTNCNPPPPEIVDCPGELPRPFVEERVEVRKDGTCWEPFEQRPCPPEVANCIELEPRQVRCPALPTADSPAKP